MRGWRRWAFGRATSIPSQYDPPRSSLHSRQEVLALRRRTLVCGYASAQARMSAMSEMKRLVDMDSQGDPLWKILVPDFKPTFILWMPCFAVALAWGIQHRYPDIFLFGLLMAVAVWSVCDAAVRLYRTIQRSYARKRAQGLTPVKPGPRGGGTTPQF